MAAALDGSVSEKGSATTCAAENANSKLRRAVRTRGHFPNDDAAIKLLYLVLNNAAEEWKRAPRELV
jgi:putative transposase